MSVALITGGSRGLGLALARELSNRKWELVIDARNQEALYEAAHDLWAHGRVHAIPGDVSDPAHRDELVRTVQSIGRLDLLVNNASILGPSPLPPLAHYPLDDLARVFAVNTIAPLALIQGLLPELMASAGVVVNLSSDAAVEPYEGWGGYGSSKAALDHLTAVQAAEVPGVSFYAFDPGDMRTVMHQDAFPGEDISDRPEPETVVPALMRLIDSRPPSGRFRSSELAAQLVGSELVGSELVGSELAGSAL